MDVLSAHMYVHYVGTVPMEARECQVPKTGATGHCEPHVGAGNPSPIPGKANTIKPPLQPPVRVLRTPCQSIGSFL